MDTRYFTAVILLIILASANAMLQSSLMDNGNNNAEHMSQDPTCSSCLEASRKAEAALDDSELFEDVEMLSVEICHVLPSDIRDMCLEKSGDFIYEAKVLLRDLFHERSLCNNTGLCIDESASVSVAGNDDTSLASGSPEGDLENCVECRKAIKDILEGLKATRSQKKITNALIVHCEEVGETEKQCKQRINSFVPMILGQLEEYTPNELCGMLNYCTASL